MGGVGGGGGVQISWAAPDSAAGPRPRAVPRLGPATAPKSLLGRSRAKVTCGGTPGTGADVLVAMESPVSGFSWHRGGAQRVPPHQRGYGGPACCPVPGAQPRPHPCSWIPLERGHFHGLVVSPPPPRALSPRWEVGGEGREGRQIPALFPREWEKPKWQRAASERAGLRRLGCLIKKWPRWPPPGTAGAFLRLPPPPRSASVPRSAPRTAPRAADFFGGKAPKSWRCTPCKRLPPNFDAQMKKGRSERFPSKFRRRFVLFFPPPPKAASAGETQPRAWHGGRAAGPC